MPLDRRKPRLKHVDQNLFTQLHVPTLGRLEMQAALLIQLPQSNPILLVYIPLSQLRHGAVGAIRVREPAALLGNHRPIVLKHIHDEVFQAGQVRRVRGILVRALVVHIGEEIRMVQVFVGRGACRVVGRLEVLRGDEVRLHPGRPRV